MIERFNHTCLMMLSMFVNDRRDNWDELLPFVMHAYRTSVHESTGYSPFRLMMGEECSLPQDVSTSELRTNREHDKSPHPFATWVRDALEIIYYHVRESLYMWRIPGVDGQVINNQGYQSHQGCQSYLAGDTQGK